MHRRSLLTSLPFGLGAAALAARNAARAPLQKMRITSWQETCGCSRAGS